MKATIVIPSIRENSVTEFLAAWEQEFAGHRVIVVEDGPRRSFHMPDWVEHVSWAEIDADLKDEAWIIPRHSGGIRNYGLLLAGRRPHDMTVMLDDDCLPCGPFLREHWWMLCEAGTADPLFNTMSDFPDLRPRGLPYERRKTRTVLNHGLWNGIPDLDGQTQLERGTVEVSFRQHSTQVPVGHLFPMSAMNVAFRPEVLPAMYHMPMGDGWPYHRFDDIWCGWVMKKACDTMGYSVRSGSPMIRHVRASKAQRNKELEADGIIENEKVWRAVLGTLAVSRSLNDCLESIHAGLAPLGNYWRKVAEAAAIWRRLCAR